MTSNDDSKAKLTGRATTTPVAPEIQPANGGVSTEILREIITPQDGFPATEGIDNSDLDTLLVLATKKAEAT